MLTNDELIDSLIVDCNSAIGNVAAGNYVAWCNTMVQMVQKLGNLKQGVRKDVQSLKALADAKAQDVEALKREIARMSLEGPSGRAETEASISSGESAAP